MSERGTISGSVSNDRLDMLIYGNRKDDLPIDNKANRLLSDSDRSAAVITRANAFHDKIGAQPLTNADKSLRNRAQLDNQPERPGRLERLWARMPGWRTTTSSLAGAAGGVAAGAAIGGGTAALAAIGTSTAFAVSGGAIGAAAGSAIPVVGTIVGGVIGLGVGLLYGKLQTARAKADMLDTSSSFKNAFQRSWRWSWLRGLTPKSLGRRIMRSIPLFSARRGLLARAWAGVRNIPIKKVDPSRKLEVGDIGVPASQDEAQRSLRYAAQAERAYCFSNDYTSHVANFDRSSKFRNRQNGINNVPQGTGYDWQYRTLASRYNAENSAPKQIFNKLPASLQNSLSSGPQYGGMAGTFHDPYTGNNIRIDFDEVNNEVVIGFNGSARLQEWGGNLGNMVLGSTPPSVRQACEVGKAVRQAVAEYNRNKSDSEKVKVVSTGHSRGGMLAQAEAIKNGGEAVVFNPEALGAGIRQYCGVLRTNVAPPGTKITNFSVRNEYVSGSTPFYAAGNLWETTTGLAAPVNFGDRKILKGDGSTFFNHPGAFRHMKHLARTGDVADPSSRGRVGRLWWNTISASRNFSRYVTGKSRQEKMTPDKLLDQTLSAYGAQGSQLDDFLAKPGRPKRMKITKDKLDLSTLDQDIKNANEVWLKKASKYHKFDQIDYDNFKNGVVNDAVLANFKRQKSKKI